MGKIQSRKKSERQAQNKTQLENKVKELSLEVNLIVKENKQKERKFMKEAKQLEKQMEIAKLEIRVGSLRIRDKKQEVMEQEMREKELRKQIKDYKRAFYKKKQQEIIHKIEPKIIE